MPRVGTEQQSHQAEPPLGIWLMHWMQALCVFITGALFAYLMFGLSPTGREAWTVSALAAAAVSVGFGAAYLVYRYRLNLRSSAAEHAFDELSERIDILTKEHEGLSRRVAKNSEGRSITEN